MLYSLVSAGDIIHKKRYANSFPVTGSARNPRTVELLIWIDQKAIDLDYRSPAANSLQMPCLAMLLRRSSYSIKSSKCPPPLDDSYFFGHPNSITPAVETQIRSTTDDVREKSGRADMCIKPYINVTPPLSRSPSPSLSYTELFSFHCSSYRARALPVWLLCAYSHILQYQLGAAYALNGWGVTRISNILLESEL